METFSIGPADATICLSKGILRAQFSTVIRDVHWLRQIGDGKIRAPINSSNSASNNSGIRLPYILMASITSGSRQGPVTSRYPASSSDLAEGIFHGSKFIFDHRHVHQQWITDMADKWKVLAVDGPDSITAGPSDILQDVFINCSYDAFCSRRWLAKQPQPS